MWQGLLSRLKYNSSLTMLWPSLRALWPRGYATKCKPRLYNPRADSPCTLYNGVPRPHVDGLSGSRRAARSCTLHPTLFLQNQGCHGSHLPFYVPVKRIHAHQDCTNSVASHNYKVSSEHTRARVRCTPAEQLVAPPFSWASQAGLVQKKQKGSTARTREQDAPSANHYSPNKGARRSKTHQAPTMSEQF